VAVDLAPVAAAVDAGTVDGVGDGATIDEVQAPPINNKRPRTEASRM